MDERSKILSHFQQIINNHDVEYCTQLLEQHNWDINSAVMTAMVANDLTDEPSNSFMDTDNFVNVDSHFNYSEASNIIDKPSTSISSKPFAKARVNYNPLNNSTKSKDNSKSIQINDIKNRHKINIGNGRILSFSIEYRGRIFVYDLPESENIGTLKDYISREISVPKCKLELSNWPKKVSSRRQKDELTFKVMQLPTQINLTLTTPNISFDPFNCSSTSSVMNESNSFEERLQATFTLNITVGEDKNYNLQFPGTKTVLEIKEGLFHLTNIPVRNQIWTGWPDDAEDTMTLAGSSILTNHNLILTATPKSSTNGLRKNLTTQMSSDEDDVDAEPIDIHQDSDFDESIDDSFPIRTRIGGPLLPPIVVDSNQATQQFLTEFQRRYGAVCPPFFVGSLSDALKEALTGQASQRKLLAVYLHHEQSILSNVFCSQILCSQPIIDTFNNSYITWGWDCTTPPNQMKFLNDASQCFGIISSDQLKMYPKEKYPLLVIISKPKSGYEILDIIQGDSALDYVLGRLLNCQESLAIQQEEEKFEERKRAMRHEEVAQQDYNYKKSLQMDKEKEELKKKEEEKKRQEEIEAEKLRKLEEKRLEKEKEEKIRQRNHILKQLPNEPNSDCKDEISTIRIRTPDNKTLSRRFYASNTLQILFNYLITEGYYIQNYKVLTSFPRRDLTKENKQKTLKELKLFPQEMLTLELTENNE